MVNDKCLRLKFSHAFRTQGHQIKCTSCKINSKNHNPFLQKSFLNDILSTCTIEVLVRLTCKKYHEFGCD